MNSDDHQNSPQVLAAPSKAKRARQSVVFVLKCALAILIVAWLVHSGRLDGRAWRVLAAPSWTTRGWLISVLFFQCGMLGFQAARWHLLVRALGAPIARRHAIIATLRGACLGAWTPAGLGLDGARCVLLSQHSTAENRAQVQRAGVLASLLDRVNGLTALLWLCLSVWSLWLGAFVLLAGIVAAMFSTSGAARDAKIPRGRLAQWTHEVAQLRRTQPRALWQSWLLALGTHACNIGAFTGTLLALETHLSLGKGAALSLATAPNVILATAIPLTPMGLGVADGVGEALLRAHGVGSGGEVVMLARALWLLLCLLCGAAFWLRVEK